MARAMTLEEAFDRALKLSGLQVITAEKLAEWNHQKNLSMMPIKDIELAGLVADDDRAESEFYVEDPSGVEFGLYRKLIVYLDAGAIYEIFIEDADRVEMWSPDIERMKAEMEGTRIMA